MYISVHIKSLSATKFDLKLFEYQTMKYLHLQIKDTNCKMIDSYSSFMNKAIIRLIDAIIASCVNLECVLSAITVSIFHSYFALHVFASSTPAIV